MPDSTLDSLLNHPGGAPAIVTPSETISFAELSGRVEASAAMLAKDHVRAGQPIGLAFADPIGHLVVSLALLKLGAQQLALSVSDPAGVLDSAAARAGVTLIVTDQATLPAKAPRLTVNWRRLPPVKPAPGQIRHEASFLLLGSGTTGRPKLISLTAEQFELQIDRELDA
ncbi:MAG: AMP-binding protein, partial [Hyphomicrobiales bacterium]|nr:AMP-binding protein [Hyphomicrobiales bacterium]